MKGSLLLIVTLFFLVIIVTAQDSATIENWCDAGGRWDDGRCQDGNEAHQQWYWTCGWYMAHVDSGEFSVADLKQNVPMCASLYDYQAQSVSAIVLASPTATNTPHNPIIVTEAPEATINPTETETPTPTEMTPEPTQTATEIAVTATDIPVIATQQSGDEQILRVGMGPRDPNSLDPVFVDFGFQEQFISQSYVGLTTIDEAQMKILPAMARSWDIAQNSDGSYSYTFYLRDDVPWVQYNAQSGQVEPLGRIVTASDFAYGIERTVAAEYYYAMYLTEPEILAVEAIDDITLKITTPYAADYQLAVFSQWFTYAQPEWVIDEFGDKWTEDEHFVSYGAYALKEWIHDESLTYVRNPFFPEIAGFGARNIDEIQFFIGEYEDQLEDYQNGLLDYLFDIPSSLSSTIHADAQLLEQLNTSTESGIYFYGFSSSIEPFDNVHCRRAFTYAIDREAVVEALQFGQAANLYASPNLIAAPQAEDYPDLGIAYDPELALKELSNCLEQKGIKDVSQLPTIELLINDGSAHVTIATMIQQMWLDNLGIEVKVIIVEFSVLIDSREDYSIWRSGWVADFPDAHNSMSVFMSESGYYGDIINTPDYDALLAESLVAPDLAARTELFAQANQLLIKDEAVIMPIYWFTRSQLTQPYLIRTESRLNYERFDKWDMQQTGENTVST